MASNYGKRRLNLKKEDVTQSDEVHTESQEKHGAVSLTIQEGPTEEKGAEGEGAASPSYQIWGAGNSRGQVLERKTKTHC